jgi:hypothetical protein
VKGPGLRTAPSLWQGVEMGLAHLAGALTLNICYLFMERGCTTFPETTSSLTMPPPHVQALSLKEAERILLSDKLSGTVRELEQVRQEAQSQEAQAEVSPAIQSPGQAPILAVHRPAGAADPSTPPPFCPFLATHPPPHTFLSLGFPQCIQVFC